MIHRILVAISASTLLLGLAMRIVGLEAIASLAWTAGAALVSISIGVSSIVQLIRRDAGVDVIALLAIIGAIVLGETLAAAIIGLMFATGRALEDYAEGKARREMSALLNPRFSRICSEPFMDWTPS